METDTLKLYAADSGIEEGLRWLIYSREIGVWTGDDASGWQRDPYPLNNCSVDVSIDALPDLGTNYFKVTSAATCTDTDGTTTVLSQVWAAPAALDEFPSGTYDGDVYYDGSEINFHGQITGNVVITGDFELKEHSGVDGDISVGGDFTLNAHVAVTGNACLGGSATFKAHSTLDGDIYAYISGAETIELKGQAQVGDIFVDGEPGSSITIILSNKDTTGNIYISPDVSLIRNFHSGANPGDIHEDWDGVNPPPPECPDIPVGGGSIISYEIL